MGEAILNHVLQLRYGKTVITNILCNFLLPADQGIPYSIINSNTDNVLIGSVCFQNPYWLAIEKAVGVGGENVGIRLVQEVVQGHDR